MIYLKQKPKMVLIVQLKNVSFFKTSVFMFIGFYAPEVEGAYWFGSVRPVQCSESVCDASNT